jgi:hypothetical protein
LTWTEDPRWDVQGWADLSLLCTQVSQYPEILSCLTASLSSELVRFLYIIVDSKVRVGPAGLVRPRPRPGKVSFLLHYLLVKSSHKLGPHLKGG